MSGKGWTGHTGTGLRFSIPRFRDGDRWIFPCARPTISCSLQVRLFLSSKGGLVDPRLRASNEHIPIVRVPRAGGRRLPFSSHALHEHRRSSAFIPPSVRERSPKAFLSSPRRGRGVTRGEGARRTRSPVPSLAFADVTGGARHGDSLSGCSGLSGCETTLRTSGNGEMRGWSIWLVWFVWLVGPGEVCLVCLVDFVG